MFFGMLGGIYNFIVLDIAAPLAIIAVAVGGILMLLSAGNPGLLGKGKTILYSALVGLVLSLGSYLIIKTLLNAIGYTGTI
jgi:hypothetical protein